MRVLSDRRTIRYFYYFNQLGNESTEYYKVITAMPCKAAEEFYTIYGDIRPLQILVSLNETAWDPSKEFLNKADDNELHLLVRTNFRPPNWNFLLQKSRQHMIEIFHGDHRYSYYSGKSNFSSEALAVAISNGNLEHVKWLHERYPEICSRNELPVALKARSPHIVDYLICNCAHSASQITEYWQNSIKMTNQMLSGVWRIWKTERERLTLISESNFTLSVLADLIFSQLWNFRGKSEAKIKVWKKKQNKRKKRFC